jgi:rRNA maturation endonuclease Nob1
MIHMAIDNDEQFEKTCNKCRSDLEKKKCLSCGKEMKEGAINTSFDEEMFNKMKGYSS